MWRALDDWEKYLHDEAPRLPLLIRCALLHYQFETIHPFLDGNGRLGRLFIALYLMDRSRLPAPLLYLSGYFDQRKSDYYDRLQYVRERGEITEWLQFFLDGVAVQATDAVERAEQLSDLRETYRIRLRGGSRAHEVIDLLFANPILTVRHVQEQLGSASPGPPTFYGGSRRRTSSARWVPDPEFGIGGSPRRSQGSRSRDVSPVRAAKASHPGRHGRHHGPVPPVIWT